MNVVVKTNVSEWEIEHDRSLRSLESFEQTFYNMVFSYKESSYPYFSPITKRYNHIARATHAKCAEQVLRGYCMDSDGQVVSFEKRNDDIMYFYDVRDDVFGEVAIGDDCGDVVDPVRRECITDLSDISQV